MHQYNRTAFQAGIVSGNLMLALYCTLVDFELALKIHMWGTGWKGNHRLIDWLNNLGETSLAAQLSHRLALLYCTSKTGVEVNVDSNNYPTMRYLRHESDFAGKSTDAQLRAVLDILNDIKQALRAKKISV